MFRTNEIHALKFINVHAFSTATLLLIALVVRNIAKITCIIILTDIHG